eukprot:TRINITY_DN3700_c1_g1_i1.p1 TRINITY_DN3700_c1_g1~~TRINITY_DN3700_c1_g1_i1.p1  ORF type:complete len:319 (+),score=27.28 TRINITY_DN3700_c1_g1_i1:46-957(+)
MTLSILLPKDNLQSTCLTPRRPLLTPRKDTQRVSSFTPTLLFRKMETTPTRKPYLRKRSGSCGGLRKGHATAHKGWDKVGTTEQLRVVSTTPGGVTRRIMTASDADKILEIRAVFEGECKPANFSKFSHAFKLLSCFGYSLSGPTFNTDKQRNLSEIYRTAEVICSSTASIQCVEAFQVGVLVTRNIPGKFVRFPISFVSSALKRRHRHLILGCYDPSSKKWGALGKSRSEKLGSSPLRYPSLASLLNAYESAYHHEGHVLIETRIGLSITDSLTFDRWILPKASLSEIQARLTGTYGGRSFL